MNKHKLLTIFNEKWNRTKLFLSILIILYAVFSIVVFNIVVKSMTNVNNINQRTEKENTIQSFGDIDVVTNPKLYAGISQNLIEIQEITKQNLSINDVETYIVGEPYEESFNYECGDVGYLLTNVNLRSEPNTDSLVYKVMSFNDEIYYEDFNDEWAIIKYKDSETGYAYIRKDFINSIECDSKIKTVYGDKRKSYMSFKAITSTSSDQYKLETVAYTGDYGVRMYKNRYLVAVGSYFTTTVGQYIDVILENGTVIPCIIGDVKKDCDTNDANMIGNDGSCVEFIICPDSISKVTNISGDMCDACTEWDSSVVEIVVYDKYISFDF